MTRGHWNLVGAAGAALLTAACGASLPSQPRYATRMADLPPPPPPVTAAPAPEAMEPRADEALPPVPSAEVGVQALPPASAPVEAAPLPEAAPQPTLEFGRPETPPPALATLTPGATYVIQPGDTVSGVGRRFGVPVQALIVLNGLGPQGGVRAGQGLILPDTARDLGPDPYATGPSPRGVEVAGADAPPPPPPPVVPPVRTPEPEPQPEPEPAPPPTPRAPAPTPPPPVQRPGQPVIATSEFPDAAELERRAAGRFAWPVRGELLTRFGTMGSGLRSDGVNIAAASGTEVRAAAAGQVAYAGDSLPGLGNTVVIVHGDGWVTAYSHLGSTAVRMEQTVRQGQAIGTVGTSGGVSQPQVHFEIRYTPSPADRPRPVDPLPLLD